MPRSPGHRLLRSLYLFLYHRLYNELAWSYDGVSWLVSLGRWHGWRRAALEFVTGERVLETGFGTGELLAEMARRKIDVTGLEASAAMQRITARKLAQRCLHVDRVQGIVQRLPFPDASFDSIVSTFPAQFILDPAAHEEFARVLRPGGRLIVVELALMTHNPLIRLLFHLVFPPSPGAGRRFAESAEAAALVTAEHVVGSGPVRPLVIVAEKPK